MKTTLLALVICLVSPAIAHAGWTDDDDYVSGSDAVAYAVQTDGTYVFAVGSDHFNGRGIIRRRALAVAGWTQPDTFVGDGVAINYAIAVDPAAGLVYVVGTTNSGAPNAPSRWYIRFSKDHGANWEPLFMGTYVQGWRYTPKSIRVGSNGQLLVALEAVDPSGNGTWFLKTNANNWTTPLDTVVPTGTGYASPSRITFDSTGAGVVRGTVFDTTGAHAIVRQFVNGGWQTVDTTTPRYGNGLANIGGVLYGTGSNLTVDHWITRSTATGSWAPSDNYADAAGTAADEVRDFNGTVYAVGQIASDWAVRMFDGISTWSTVDTWYIDTQHLGGEALDLIAAGGKLWVVGSLIDHTGVGHWHTRVLTP